MRDSDLASGTKGLALRMMAAAALIGVAAPLGAQETVNAATSAAAPPAVENIGPRELSNFSINGTVTRPAERPAVQPPAAAATSEPQPRPAAPPAEQARSEPVRASVSQPAADRPVPRASADPLSRPPTLSGPTSPVSAAASAAAPAFGSAPDSVPAEPIQPDYGFSPLPWIAALLLLGAGMAIYFGRQRRGQRYAAAGEAPLRFAAPEPAPRPAPVPRAQPGRKPPPNLLRQPAPETAPPPAAAPATKPDLAGIVSTGLRPWIEVEFTPQGAIVNDEQAAISFDVTLFNSGSAPARDVAVDALLISAGNQQEEQLGTFYTMDKEHRDKIPIIAPLSRVSLKSAVRLPRAAIQEYDVEGRKLFMPMVAINSVYRWSSGQGQSAVSFLVGRAANDSDKLAPLRLDQGARGWKGLAARRFEKGIRR